MPLTDVINRFNAVNTEAMGSASKKGRAAARGQGHAARTTGQIVRRELVNAFSMVPVVMFAYRAVFVEMDEAKAEWPLMAKVTFVFVVTHTMASMLYHFSSVKWAYDNSVDRYWYRCLDLSMMHVWQMVASVAISREPLYALLAVPFNVYAIYSMWATRGAGENRFATCLRIAGGVTLCMAPMAPRGDWHNFGLAAVSFAVLAASFVLNDQYMEGWGHGLMHLGVAAHCYFIEASVCL